MPEEMIVQHCSPTMAGIKTASLFNCTYDDVNLLYAQIAQINVRLMNKGIQMIVLGYPSDKHALIYVYRPSLLKEDLNRKDISSILQEIGYEPSSMGKCLTELMTRLQKHDSFPHEIGCFLGYPAEDVKGFMEHKSCKSFGMWKVYGDEKKAAQLFAMYASCTDTYMKRYSHGATLEYLTIQS